MIFFFKCRINYPHTDLSIRVSSTKYKINVPIKAAAFHKNLVCTIIGYTHSTRNIENIEIICGDLSIRIRRVTYHELYRILFLWEFCLIASYVYREKNRLKPDFLKLIMHDLNFLLLLFPLGLIGHLHSFSLVPTPRTNSSLLFSSN